MDIEAVFGLTQPVIGMVHLPGLPGAPGYGGDRAGIRERAVADAQTLVAGGCDAVLVENLGDVPYHPESVPAHTVAEMTAAAAEVAGAVNRPHGVNVLRNDAEAALSVAAATGGEFVRVNVHTGVRATDQGLVEGNAHRSLRLRDRLDADVAVLADVAVKHSSPVGPSAEKGVERLARETVDRGLADGLVVSGPATGESADDSQIRAVLEGRDDATRDVPVFVGSGVTEESVANLLALADGVIVGTALKRGGETAAPVEHERVASLLSAAGR